MKQGLETDVPHIDNQILANSIHHSSDCCALSVDATQTPFEEVNFAPSTTMDWHRSISKVEITLPLAQRTGKKVHVGERLLDIGTFLFKVIHFSTGESGITEV